MRIYHISDIHSETWRIQELIDQVEPNSLIAVSGDLIDWTGMNSPEELRSIQSHLRELGAKAHKKGCLITICSGNHDAWATKTGFSPQWLVPREVPGLMRDGDTQLIYPDDQGMIVTNLPWRDYEIPPRAQHIAIDEIKKFAKDVRTCELCVEILREGQTLREVYTSAPWVWLHHNPPAFTSLAADCDASQILIQWIQKYQPDIVLTGHCHTPSQKFQTIGRTTCSNPGRNHVTTSVNKITISYTKEPNLNIQKETFNI